MGLKAMTWAFALPLEPRAKIALLAIADHADDDGKAWPGLDTVAAKSSQSRATVLRRIKDMARLGVLRREARFRPDGTQTTDMIILNLALSPADIKRADAVSCDADQDVGDDTGSAAAPQGGGCQADTLGSQSCNGRVSDVTGGGLHCGNPQDEPSLNRESPPSPPPGGVCSQASEQEQAKRSAAWERFARDYPGITTMDQRAARAAFDELSIDNAEWAAAVLGAYRADLTKLRRPPKNAHLWLSKGMFTNYPRDSVVEAPPERVWISEGSDADRAMAFLLRLVRKPRPFVRVEDGRRGWYREQPVGADALSMLVYEGDNDLRWPFWQQGGAEFAAWMRRMEEWTGKALPIICDDGGRRGIRAPMRWPPRKDGSFCSDGVADAEGEVV